MPASCKDIRAALAACLQESDCVMIQRKSAADCLRPPLKDTLSVQCQQLQKAYGQCKKGQIDMRKRFRGNKPIAVSKEFEGSGEDSHMLYAGNKAAPEKQATEVDESKNSNAEPGGPDSGTGMY